MIKLLHDHLRSSLGVAVENPPLQASLFIPLYPSSPPLTTSRGEPTILCEENGVGEIENHASVGMLSSSTSRYNSRIVPLDYLHHLFKRHDDESKSVKPFVVLRDTPTKSRSEASGCEITTSGSVGGYSSRHEVVSLPVSPFMLYDFTHSCNECSKYVRGTPISPAEYLTSFLPPTTRGGSSNGDTREGLTLKWRIPGSQQKHCVINSSSKTLERLKLPTIRLKGDRVSSQIMTPVFTPTLGRDSCGLFNLFHGQFYNLHVLVTSETEFGNYCKAWPNHVIMALPDKATMGLGKLVRVHLHHLSVVVSSPTFPLSLPYILFESTTFACLHILPHISRSNSSVFSSSPSLLPLFSLFLSSLFLPSFYPCQLCPPLLISLGQSIFPFLFILSSIPPQTPSDFFPFLSLSLPILSPPIFPPSTFLSHKTS